MASIRDGDFVDPCFGRLFQVLSPSSEGQDVSNFVRNRFSPSSDLLDIVTPVVLESRAVTAYKEGRTLDEPHHGEHSSLTSPTF